MPAVPLTEENVLASSNVVKYPNPFFDLSNNFIPKNIKTLFKYCRDFFHVNSFLRNVVTKLTEYPITDILYDSNISAESKEKWDKTLHDELKIKTFLIEVGLDYFTYGNAFISSMLKFKRFLACTNCGHEELIDNVKFELKNYEFYGSCKNCKTPRVKMTIKDEYLKSVKNFRLIRWAPENIDIDYNPITGSATYYYTIPAKIKSLIIQGNVAILKDTPEVFLQSLKSSKKIILEQNNLYHLKYPTLAEEDMGWGKPMILPALKEIYYLQTLRRGNEAIAVEHIVPKKTVSPANTTTMDPYSQMNLGKWRSEVEMTIRKWKADPNHIAVFPIPMQYQELGGNAKMLMVTPEMRFLEETIINSLGVPLEFIKGGASWTGSSISLRIVENHFLTYREQLADFLNFFLVPKLVGYLSLPKVKLMFMKFKMSDDSESKQLAINLNAAGKISDSRLLDEFGYDSTSETDAIKKGRNEALDIAIEEQEKQAEAQGRAMVIQARYQVRAQMAAQDEELKVKAEMFQEELAKENAAIPEDPIKLINRYALELVNLPEDLQNARLQELAIKMPITYSFVTEKLMQFQAQRMAMFGMTGADTMEEEEGTTKTPSKNKPNNKKDVGKKKSDQVPLTKSDTEKSTDQQILVHHKI